MTSLFDEAWPALLALVLMLAFTAWLAAGPGYSENNTRCWKANAALERAEKLLAPDFPPFKRNDCAPNGAYKPGAPYVE